MAILAAELVAIVTAETGQAERALARTGAMFGEAGAAAGRFGKGAAIAAVAIGAASVHMAAQFDQSMIRIHTQAGVPLPAIKGLSDAVLHMAGQVGFSANDLSQALYHIESTFQSTGINSAKAMDLLRVAAEGAKIGGSDLVDTTNALDSAVVSAIPGAENYDKAMGALNATVGAGDMTMQDLANALSTGVVPVVKNYGLTLNDVGAALAVFGDNNIRGAIAGTQLRMAVQSLAVPTRVGDGLLQKLGITTDQLAKDMQQGGLNKALVDLNDHMVKAGITGNKVGDFLTQAFGKKAGVGLAILIDQLDRFHTKEDEVAKGADRFGEAWAVQQQQFKQKMDDMKAAVGALMIKLGNELIPVITKVANALFDLGQKKGFKDFLQSLKEIGHVVGDVAKAIGPFVLDSLKGLGKALGDLAKFLGTDWGKLALIAVGIRLISAAVMANKWTVTLAAAVLAFGWLYDHDPGLAKGLLAVAAAMWAVNYAGYGMAAVPWMALATAIGVGVYEAIKHFHGLKRGFDDAFNATKRFLGDVVNLFSGHNWAQSFGPESAFGRAITFKWLTASGVQHTIGGFLAGVVNLFSAHNWAAVGRGIDRYIGPNSSLGRAITFKWLNLGGVQHTVGGFLAGVVDLFSGHNWASLGAGISRYIGPNSALGRALTFKWIGGALARVGHDISNWAHNFWHYFSGLSDAKNRLVHAGADLISGLWNGIKSGVARFLGGIGSWLMHKIVDPIKSALGIHSPSTVMMGVGRDVIQGLINGIRGAIGGLLSLVGSIPGRIMSFFAAAGSWLLNAGSSLMSGLRSGIVSGYNTVSGWLSGLHNRVVSFAATAGSWLVSHGSNLMHGLASGISSGYGAVASFVGSIPGRIMGAFSGAGGWLVNAGSAIMGGLGRGIESAAQGVFNFVSSIAGKIASLKGPIDYDRRLLIPHGRAIMAGLDDGLTAGYVQVQRTVAGMAAGIAAAASRSTASVPVRLNLSHGGLGALGGLSGTISHAVTAMPAAAGSGGTVVNIAVRGSILAERDLQTIANRGFARTRRLSGPILTRG